MITGIQASRGIGIGKARVLRPQGKTAVRDGIDAGAVQEESGKLDAAIDKAVERFTALRKQAEVTLGEAQAQMMDAYILIVSDEVFITMARDLIRTKLIPAETAVSQAVETLRAMFMAIPNDYMRQRADDMEHAGSALEDILRGHGGDTLNQLDGDTILIARDLSPADTLGLDRNRVRGFVMETGGTTSHTAILARSMEIPAVVGCGSQVWQIQDGDILIVDGHSGTIVISPDEGTLNIYRERAERDSREAERLKQLKTLPACTADGQHLELAGNIGGVEDIQAVLEKGGDGVGLFRTECLYMGRDTVPDEEEQYAVYRDAVMALGGKPLIIRTLDAGGDKKTACLNIPEEDNPFLGYRAIRICLNEPELFRTQLRAILRAAVHGDIRVMFPMISGMGELRQARAHLAEAARELDAAGVAHQWPVPCGIMIEIPSAAMAAPALAKEADFFSIGTNDLCQYMLAVDRMNTQVSHLYDPLNPGVMHMIFHVIRAAREAGITAGMCGEMASDPEMAVLLAGMGLQEFSMSASAIPEVKDMLRRVTMTKAREIVEKAMVLDTGDAVRAMLREELYAVKNV